MEHNRLLSARLHGTTLSREWVLPPAMVAGVAAWKGELALTVAAVAAAAIIGLWPRARPLTMAARLAAVPRATSAMDGTWDVSVRDAEVVFADLRGTATSFDLDDDRRAYFARMYSRMTAETVAQARAGTFDDPGWVLGFVVHFAAYYQDALAAYEQGLYDRVPEAWQAAFDECALPDHESLLDALLGMSAHVNYDLALVVRDAILRDAASPGGRDNLPARHLLVSRHRDFVRIDAVIASAALPVANDLSYAPERPFNRLLASERSSLWGDGIASWRADAWAVGVRLAAAYGDERATADIVTDLNRAAVNWARILISLNRYGNHFDGLESRHARTLIDDPRPVNEWVRSVNSTGYRIPAGRSRAARMGARVGRSLTGPLIAVKRRRLRKL